MQEENPCVFVVDDDRSIRESLRDLLCSIGLNVQTFASAQAFLTSQRPDVPSCLVLDVQLPGLSGLDLQQELAKVQCQIPIIFITGHGDIPMTVRAMKAGAIELPHQTVPATTTCSTPSSRRLPVPASWRQA